MGRLVDGLPPLNLSNCVFVKASINGMGLQHCGVKLKVSALIINERFHIVYMKAVIIKRLLE